MHEYLTKKLKTEKTFRSCLIALALFWVVILIMAVNNKSMFQYLINLAIVLIVLIFVYFRKFYNLKLSANRIIKNGSENAVADIDFEKPLLPKSGIYCGTEAMYSKKDDVIILYNEISSVKCLTKGRITAFAIYFSDGKKLVVRADKEEFKNLLDDITAERPDVLIDNI